jgi:hypothetical protein
MKNVKVVFQNPIEIFDYVLDNRFNVVSDLFKILDFAIKNEVEFEYKNIDFHIDHVDANLCEIFSFFIEIIDEENTRIFNVFYAGVAKL